MTGYSIDFTPFIPLWSILILAAVWLLGSGFLIWRGVPATWLRAGLAALILAALANPTLHQERREPNSDVTLLIVDETPSQEITGRIAETREAADALRQSLSLYEPGLEVREVVLRHDSISDSNEGTILLDEARAALADVPARRYAGSIVVTDGQIHDDELLDGLPPGPLHAVLVGDPDRPDRRLQIVEYPSFAIVGEPIEMVVRIDDPTAEAGPEFARRWRSMALRSVWTGFPLTRTLRLRSVWSGVESPLLRCAFPTCRMNFRFATIGRWRRSTACGTACGCC